MIKTHDVFQTSCIPQNMDFKLIFHKSIEAIFIGLGLVFNYNPYNYVQM